MNYLAWDILLMTLMLKLASLQITPKDPTCTVNFGLERGKKRCCAHYRTIGLKCYPCVGSFGIECMQKCPDGFYGVQCAELCSCTKCNKTTGVCLNETIISTEEPDKTNQSQLKSIIIGVGTVLGTIIIFILLFVLYTRNRKPGGKGGVYQEEKGKCNDENSSYYRHIESHIYYECEPVPKDILESQNLKIESSINLIEDVNKPV